ncbi:MAG: DNA-3-methyladenine glycosylase [Bryobacteraceae bacterium]
MTGSRILTREFYERPTVEVARDLLGKVLVHGRTAGRIVEVEAYLGGDDRAAHSSRGLTPRTSVLFGPPGHAYVYFIYGMHECFNVVAERNGKPGGILVRAVEPLCGVPLMKRRRPKARTLVDLTSGPGKLTQALGITRRNNGCNLTAGSLTIRELSQFGETEIGVSPRIGIRHCADWPLRFFVPGNAFVSATPKPREK